MTKRFYIGALKRLVVFSLLVSSLGLVGCDEESSLSQKEDTSPPITVTSMRGYGEPLQESLSPGNFDIENLAEETTEIDKNVATASGWREAHKQVQDLLESSSSVPQFVREQAAAYAMFREYLSDETWRENITDKKAEVLGFYTNLLVKNRSPESDLVYSGLQKLEGNWSKKQVSNAAKTALKAADRKYGSFEKSKSSSPQASSDEDDSTPGLADGREQHAKRVMESNRKLRNMLEGTE